MSGPVSESALDAPDDDAAFEAALETLERKGATVRLVSSVDGRRVVTSAGRSVHTVAAAYATEALLASLFLELEQGLPVFAVADDDGTLTALKGWADASGRQHVEEVGIDDVPSDAVHRLPALTALEALLPELMDAEAAADTADASPIMLSLLANAALDDLLGAEKLEELLHTVTRRQDGYPFPAYGALAGAGRLAVADATQGMLRIRSELETCVELFAERWGTLVHLSPADAFLELRPDPALTPGFGRAYHPSAHMLGDWLELSTAELAEGRGQLIILGRRVAEDTEAVVEQGRIVPARPITENPWYLWIIDTHVVTRIRLRSHPRPPEPSPGE
ncbi:hypothetical protein ACXET9_02720 [Brachybacterium sp. DNPG3]